jgi:hypothetical protein
LNLLLAFSEVDTGGFLLSASGSCASRPTEKPETKKANRINEVMGDTCIANGSDL